MSSNLSGSSPPDGVPDRPIDPQDDVTPVWVAPTTSERVNAWMDGHKATGGQRPQDSIFDYVPSMTSGMIPTDDRRPSTRLIAAGVAGLLLAVLIVAALGTANEEPPTTATGMEPVPATVPVGAPVNAAVRQALPAAPGTADGAAARDGAVDGVAIAEEDIVILDDSEETTTEVGAGSEPRRRRRAAPPPSAATPLPKNLAKLRVVELDPLAVRRTVRGKMVHLHRCYDEALRVDESLRGRIQILITIGVTGRVDQVRLTKDSLRHAGVTQCVRAQVRNWRFRLGGRLAEPTEVSFPVNFSNRAG